MKKEMEYSPEMLNGSVEIEITAPWGDAQLIEKAIKEALGEERDWERER